MSKSIPVTMSLGTYSMDRDSKLKDKINLIEHLDFEGIKKWQTFLDTIGIGSEFRELRKSDDDTLSQLHEYLTKHGEMFLRDHHELLKEFFPDVKESIQMLHDEKYSPLTDELKRAERFKKVCHVCELPINENGAFFCSANHKNGKN